MIEREGLADHAADGKTDVVDFGEAQSVEHGGDVGGEQVHRVRPADRIAAAVPAHIDAQHAKTAGEQRGHLFGPHAAVGGERVCHANDRRGLRTNQVVSDMAAVQWQQHEVFLPDWIQTIAE